MYTDGYSEFDDRVKTVGRWVNPLGEKKLPGERVPAHRRGAFERHLEALLQRLASNQAGAGA